ncbi:MAG: hypothetical protein BGO01_13945 [Armatimonadetes bacterium 55-13]|nr:cytochrome c maturation protein CcmE [Armatimonadota bacterium]OJU64823.1 MAG: hypothetical protein BGO01_13945 [Armatimonadetes bacterium 55-13]
MKNKRFGAVITGLLVAAAILGVSVAFIANASPYVTVSEARKSGATNVHLKGILEKDSIKNDFKSKSMSFKIKDANGDEMTIVYTGPPPQDITQATDIVAIGTVKGEEFHSDKLLIKCPSKYEGTKKAQS